MQGRILDTQSESHTGKALSVVSTVTIISELVTGKYRDVCLAALRGIRHYLKALNCLLSFLTTDSSCRDCLCPLCV